MRVYVKALPPIELLVWLLIFLAFYRNGVTWPSLKSILDDEHNRNVISPFDCETFSDVGSKMLFSSGELDQAKREADAKFYARLKIKLQVSILNNLFISFHLIYSDFLSKE
jgi:hypothetical protein